MAVLKFAVPTVAALTLGAVAAFNMPASADPPVTGAAPTVYRTVTETRTVNRRVDGHTVGWWRVRAVTNRRGWNSSDANLDAARAHIKRLLVSARPTVFYALALARAAYGYDQTARARCESTFDPGNVNAKTHASGVMQFLPSTWRTTPFASFNIFDPVANVLAGGWMIRAGRSGEWSCGL